MKQNAANEDTWAVSAKIKYQVRKTHSVILQSLEDKWVASVISWSKNCPNVMNITVHTLRSSSFSFDLNNAPETSLADGISGFIPNPRGVPWLSAYSAAIMDNLKVKIFVNYKQWWYAQLIWQLTKFFINKIFDILEI